MTGSALTLEGAQIDGSRWCREAHTLTGGETFLVNYLRAPGDDAQAIMAARVVAINEQIADAEALANFERDGALTTLHQTGAQFAARFREEVRQASRERACYLAWWLLRRIAAGHITDAQCRTAFGLTLTQWNTLKTNVLTPRSNAWASVLSAEGA